MRRLCLAVATTVVLSTGALHAAAADTTIPKSDRVDVSKVKIANTKKTVAVSFAYKQAPADAQWAATIGLDTNPRRKGPEFRISVDNMCGTTGLTVAPAGSPNDPDWAGGCGEAGKCSNSYSVVRDEDYFLRAVKFKKVKGCLTASEIRLTGEFRTLDLANPSAQPFYDQVPGKKGVYTKWTRTGQTKTYKDRS